MRSRCAASTARRSSSRGGGTSLAGQCTNAAVVIDWTKYCNRLVSVDPGGAPAWSSRASCSTSSTAQLAQYGLRYGPEPATHPNCTIGGMIGNNSCGATAQRTGKVVDNIARLEVLLYDGTRFWCGPTSDDEYARDRAARVTGRPRCTGSCAALRDAYADEIRARYPDIPRRVSGYNLDSLLPEHGFDVAGAARRQRVDPGHRAAGRAEARAGRQGSARSSCSASTDVMKAADAVPAILPHEPIALEGLDHRLIHDQQRQAPQPGRAAASCPRATAS